MELETFSAVAFIASLCVMAAMLAPAIVDGAFVNVYKKRSMKIIERIFFSSNNEIKIKASSTTPECDDLH